MKGLLISLWGAPRCMRRGMEMSYQGKGDQKNRRSLIMLIIDLREICRLGPDLLCHCRLIIIHFMNFCKREL